MPPLGVWPHICGSDLVRDTRGVRAGREMERDQGGAEAETELVEHRRLGDKDAAAGEAAEAAAVAEADDGEGVGTGDGGELERVAGVQRSAALDGV